ncbi:SDR family NAD(P)-dependent oxidoreductase [Microbacterium sp. zg-YB36]|uniref:SDR family NAD(P)-dependent oxidoreductase n=1 Tax=Microbacterium sp. zg-YB36 TaxID=2969407 RepID=UPI00214AE7FA|nr:SDR family NAD(P)-dependent oxidoreductase [Microbacterium sp. zg-YB36]MDL5352111.1 SDR family NAD(P)-dependent oxidoreductase [Microbacterium sp. zg-YB36]
MNPVAGATVLITGGARGMGELFARRAIAGGARAIALWDVDEDAASALASDLRGSGVDVRAYRVDISRQEEIVEALARMRDEIGVPDILVNNAGIVRAGVFWENDPQRDIEATMRVNTLAAMWLTREVLPAMIADTSRPKRILNVASAAGTLANPNMSVYAASKWAMIGWSESVRLELVKSGHGHVAITTFCPSYVSTGMFAGARGPLLTPIMTPRQATQAAWQGMVRGTPMVLRPWTVKLAMAARGVLPTRVWDVLAARVFQVYSSMDHFTGRS